MRIRAESEGDHVGDLADELDREAVLLRMHDDPVDQAAQFARLQTASASYDLAANGQIALP